MSGVRSEHSTWRSANSPKTVLSKKQRDRIVWNRRFSEISSPPSTASESMATGEQQVGNAIGVTRGELSSLQFELTSKAKTHYWNNQKEKLKVVIAKLKCAQINEFDLLLEIFINIDACLPIEFEESNIQLPPVEMFEFLSVSIDALRDTLVQLRLSSNFDSVNKEQEALSEAAALDWSADTSKAQCQKAEETLSSLQYLLQRLLTTSKNDEEFSLRADNGCNKSCVAEILKLSRTLFKELAELANGRKAEPNCEMAIAEMTEKLEEFQQHFTPAVLRQTREFKSVLATLECKRNSASNDTVVTPFQEELEYLSELQRVLTFLNFLIIRSSSKCSSSLNDFLTSPKGSEFKTSILEECQRSLLTITSLVLQLKSMGWYECPPLRSVLGETITTGLKKCVLKRVLELRDKFGDIARRASKDCDIEKFLKEVAIEILDCYNFILENVFKYVGSVSLDREHQNCVYNRRLEAVQSQLLYAQREKTCEEKLVIEGERIAKINQQLIAIKNQLLEVQQEIFRQESLIKERDTKIAEIQRKLDEVKNQLLAGVDQRIHQENLVQERDSKIADIQCDSGSTKVKVDENERQNGLNWEKANELALGEACRLKTSNEDSAAGSVYKVEAGGQTSYSSLFVSTNTLRWLLVNSTNNLCSSQLHVVPEDECERIHLTRDRVCHVWNNRPRGKHKGNTAVELRDEAAIECWSSAANYKTIKTSKRSKTSKVHSGEEVRFKSCISAFANTQSLSPLSVYHCNQ